VFVTLFALYSLFPDPPIRTLLVAKSIIINDEKVHACINSEYLFHIDVARASFFQFNGGSVSSYENKSFQDLCGFKIYSEYSVGSHFLGFVL